MAISLRRVVRATLYLTFSICFSKGKLNVAGYNSSLIAYLPCDMKFLWEFIFADWQFFVFCAN